MFKEELESEHVPVTERLLRQQFHHWFRSNVSFLSYMFLVLHSVTIDDDLFSLTGDEAAHT